MPRCARCSVFRGSEPLPFGDEIRPVADLVNYLMTGSPTPP